MSLARFSVARPVTVAMRIAALVLLGAICVTRLPVDLLPRVSLPTVAVVTSWPNVAPEEIEAQVTRPIEQAVSSAPDLYEVSSSTVEGTSVVRVQFQWSVDVGRAAVDVLQLVERARQNFPTDPTLQSPTVFRYDPSQLPILVMGVSGLDDPVKLRTLMDNQVSPIIESADGVAAAVVTGGEKRAVIVDVDPDRARAHRITLAEISRRISQENVNLPAGIARQSDTEYTIRSLGWFVKPEEIAQIPVGTYNGQPVSLGQVASVRDAHPETRMFTRLDSVPAVGLVITKQSNANTVETAENVMARLKQAQKLYPYLKFHVAYDQSRFVEGAVHDVKDSAMIGGVLAVLILLFFLRNVRSTLVVALSIPISITSTFALLYVCGFTLNTMSLGGLALATGLIVDDAVVVLENIFRHIERDGKPPAEAAVTGTNEIMSAVTASTMTIMVVFLPLLLIKGQAGQMFTQFALVVIFSIAVSLLDAVTVVPMLASRVIQGEAHAHESTNQSRLQRLMAHYFDRWGEWFNQLDRSYRTALQWSIHHRSVVATGAVLVTAASFLLVPLIGTETLPETDSGDVQITVKMPVGTALEKTDAVLKQIEGMLKANPNVETIFSAAGTTLSLRGTSTSMIPNQGSVTVRLKENRRLSTLEIIRQMRRQFSSVAGARLYINQVDLVTRLIAGGNQNLDVNIFGSDISTLFRLGQEAASRLKTTPGFENVDVNWQEATPELQFKIDRHKALMLGLNFSDIGNTLNTATNGTIASYFQEGGFQYPIIVRLPEDRRKTVDELLSLDINPSGGSGVPNGTSSRNVLLRQVATPIYAVGPSEITRLNRQRYIAVTGMPQGRSVGDIQGDIQKSMQTFQMPEGYYWDWGTTQRRRTQEFADMGLAVWLAIALIYMLLASQFESFVHPFTVLLSVPLSAVGVILGLFLSGKAFGLTAFIGLLMLVGIVVKNGILLVDYTNLLRHRGMPRDEAVLTASPTRLRPILMTAGAAILGMLPIAIGLGRGSEIQAPMATAVVGGLTTSSFLTLFVVPVAYTFLDDAAQAFQRWWSGGPIVVPVDGHASGEPGANGKARHAGESVAEVTEEVPVQSGGPQ